jgi:hypothetical protein
MQTEFDDDELMFDRIDPDYAYEQVREREIQAAATWDRVLEAIGPLHRGSLEDALKAGDRFAIGEVVALACGVEPKPDEVRAELYDRVATMTTALLGAQSIFHLEALAGSKVAARAVVKIEAALKGKIA